jgi:nitroreductase
MIEDLIRQNRSYRRFHQDVPVRIETLRAMVDLARMSASAANKQPLKYILSSDRETNARIFPHTRWAEYRFPNCAGCHLPTPRLPLVFSTPCALLAL